MFFRVKILGANVTPKAVEGFKDEMFYAFLTKKFLYKLGPKSEKFNYIVKEKDGIISVKNICTCDEHDAFESSVSKEVFLNNDIFKTTAKIIIAHNDEKNFVKGTEINLLVEKIKNIITLRQAEQYVNKFYKNIKND